MRVRGSVCERSKATHLWELAQCAQEFPTPIITATVVYIAIGCALWALAWFLLKTRRCVWWR